MKKLLFVLVAGIAIVSFSCKKDSSNLVPTAKNVPAKGAGNENPNIPSVSYIWKINSFVVNGVDMTAQFATYDFDIRAAQLMIENGEIVAVNGANTYYGKWNRADYNQVGIYFNDPVLSQLNDEWFITNNRVHDISMQTTVKTLSFHTDGTTWP